MAANPPSPPPVASPVRRDYGQFRFDGEKETDSPVHLQNLLTALGRRVEEYTRCDDRGCKRELLPTYSHNKDFNLELKSDRMTRLRNSPLLRIRNGFDITAVVYLVNYDSYKGSIVVRSDEMKKYVRNRMRVSKRGRNSLKWVIQRADFDSEDPDFLNLIPDAEYEPNNKQKSPPGDASPSENRRGMPFTDPPKKKKRRVGVDVAVDVVESDSSDSSVDFGDFSVYEEKISLPIDVAGAAANEEDEPKEADDYPDERGSSDDDDSGADKPKSPHAGAEDSDDGFADDIDFPIGGW